MEKVGEQGRYSLIIPMSSSLWANLDMAEAPSYKGAVIQSDKEQHNRVLTSRLERS